MTTNNNPSPRSWRNRIQRAPRRNWVIFLILVLAFFACAIITSSCLGRVVQAETVQAQNSASWWQRLWNSGDNASASETETTADSGAIIDIQFTPAADVLAQLELLGYSSVEEFAQAWGITLGGDLQNANVDPREVGTCPFETQGCIRILREKDQANNVIPFRISNATTCWHDGWRREPGETRPGGYTNPERSGLPPSASGILVEGVTLRVCKNTGSSGTLPGEADVDAPAATKTPTEKDSNPKPTSAPQGTGGGTNATWSEASAREEFHLAADVVLTASGNGYAASHASGKFYIENNRTVWIDGYRDQPGELFEGSDDPKFRIPPGFKGEVGGATLYPPGS